MQKFWQTVAAAAILIDEAPAAPFGGSLGFLGQVEFPMEFFGYESAWPATPAVGLSYEVPVHEKVVWTFDLTYAYKVFDHKTQPEDSQYYATLSRRGDEIFDLSVDHRTRGHFATFRAMPALIAWKHFQFGFGYHITSSYTRTTGYNSIADMGITCGSPIFPGRCVNEGETFPPRPARLRHPQAMRLPRPGPPLRG